MEKALNSLHEEAKFQNLEIDPKKAKPSDEPAVHRTSNKPFAKIDKVTVNSPAYVAVREIRRRNSLILGHEKRRFGHPIRAPPCRQLHETRATLGSCKSQY